MFERVFLDMDGVLCDFISHAMRAHGSEFNPEKWPLGEWAVEKVLGISADEFWLGIERTPGFWLTLPRFHWTDWLVNLVKSHDPKFMISTSPSQDPNCLSEKYGWLHRNIGPEMNARRFMMGSRKELLASPGRLLIDDSDANCKRWEEAGGTVFLLPQPWNSRGGIPYSEWVVELKDLLGD